MYKYLYTNILARHILVMKYTPVYTSIHIQKHQPSKFKH